MKQSADDRFNSRYVVCPTGCWIWCGATNGQGEYGQFSDGGVRYGAHVWSYKRYSGKVSPRGYDHHHKCLVTLCVNWRHLTPVPPAVNQKYRRGKMCRRHRKRYVWRKVKGVRRRVCVACGRDRNRKWRAARAVRKRAS